MTHPWMKALGLCLILSLRLWGQDYQTQFMPTQFDRSRGPVTLNGPVEVEAATGAVRMSIPLGRGIGARGVAFRPTLSALLSPQAWYEGVLGVRTKMEGFTLSPGHFDLLVNPLRNKSVFTSWLGPDGSTGTLAKREAPLSQARLEALLTAFKVEGSVAPWPHEGTVVGTPLMAARGSNGELVIGLKDPTRYPESSVTDDSGSQFMPGAVLVVKGDLAWLYILRQVLGEDTDIRSNDDGRIVVPAVGEPERWTYVITPADPQVAHNSAPPSYDMPWVVARRARYVLSRIVNRTSESVEFTYDPVPAAGGHDLGFTARWKRKEVVQASLTCRASAPPVYANGAWNVFTLRLTTFQGEPDTTQLADRYEVDASLAGQLPPTPEFEIGDGPAFLRPTLRVQEVRCLDSQEWIRLTYAPGPTVTIAGTPGRAEVLSAVETRAGRRVELDWTPYATRPNALPAMTPGYRGTITANGNYAYGVTTLRDRDLVLNQVRTTTHTRVVPQPMWNYSSGWVSTAFYDAITHPDGHVTLHRFVEPLSDTSVANAKTGGADAPNPDDPIHVLAYLKHMVREERTYAPMVDWRSDLSAAPEASTAYKVVVSDRWDLHQAGNPEGLLQYGAVPAPTRIRTWEREAGRLTHQESSQWDAQGPGWQRSQQAIYLSSAPGFSLTWRSAAQSGSSPAVPPAGYVHLHTTNVTYEPTGVAQWFLGRKASEAATVEDLTGWSAPGLPGPFALPSKNFTYATGALNLLTAFTLAASDQGKLATTFTYGGAEAAEPWKATQLTKVDLGGTAPGGGPFQGDPLGVEAYGYDAWGHLSAIQPKGMAGALGETHSWRGEALTQVDASGFTTGYQWDPVGRLLQILPPGEVPTTVSYPADGHSVQVVRGLPDQPHQQSTYIYNGYGELVLERRLNGDGTANHRVFAYDAAGRKVAETVWRPQEGNPTDSLAANLVQDLTDLQCVQWKVLASGSEVCTKTLTVVTDPKLAAGTRWTFDGQGRVTQVVNPMGEVTATAHVGLTTRHTVAPGSTAQAVTVQTQDALGRLVRIVDALGQTTEYRYHPLGKIAEVRQMGLGSPAPTQVRSWSYNGLGWLTSLTQPESGVTRYGDFDAAGRPWTTVYGATSASPRTVWSPFTPLGQVKYVEETRGTQPAVRLQTFTYGGSADGAARNRLLSASANGIQRTLGYDSGHGRLASLRYDLDGLSFTQGLTYDAFGRLARRTYPDGNAQVITYYDDKDLPKSTGFGASPAPAGLLLPLDYDPVSWSLRGATWANNAQSLYTYAEDQQRLATLSHAIPGLQLKTWSYGYSPAGLLTRDGEDYYRYDLLGRLVEAFVMDPFGAGGPQGLRQAFDYDAFGNRKGMTTERVSNWTPGAVPPVPAVTTSLAGDARDLRSFAMTAAELDRMSRTNQLPASLNGVPTGATYDPQGNLTAILGRASQSLALTYDALGRITALRGPVSEDYGHDDQGLRIRVKDTATGKVAYHLYNEARQLIATYEKVGAGALTWKKDMVYLGTKEVAEVDSAGKTWVTFVDHLGSPRFEWNGTAPMGGKADNVNLLEQKFMPFGESLLDPAAQQKFAKGFTNHEQTDASGLIYMQARFYAPWFGRFLSPDPKYAEHFEGTQGWNIYSYCENNPAMRWDPDGMDWVDDSLIGAYRVLGKVPVVGAAMRLTAAVTNQTVDSDGVKAVGDGKTRLAQAVTATVELASDSAQVLSGGGMSATLKNIAADTAMGVAGDAATGGFSGGSHAQTSKPAGDDLESHHMPPKGTGGLSSGDGPAIQMEKQDHKATSSWGRSDSANAWRKDQSQLAKTNPRQMMAKEIRDVRRASAAASGSPSKYNKALRQMLTYAKTVFDLKKK